jgi:hypothetical protein
MKYWWERNQNIEQGDITKDEIEDYTGCIPLLLESCLVDGKVNLENKAFDKIYKEAVGFVENINMFHYLAWNPYVEPGQPLGHS